MRSLVTTIFLHVYESWTLTAELQKRIRAMETRCYRKILHISYNGYVTNEKAHANIQQAIGPHEDLLTIDRKETQTEMEWTSLPFIRSDQRHFARHSERGEEKTR